MTIKDLTLEQAKELAELMYPWPNDITNFEYWFQPYIIEWYEDAREYFTIKFDGPGIGDTIYHHKIDIGSDLDCHSYFIKPLKEGEKEDGPRYMEMIGTRNQRAVQMKFIEWGLVPSDKNQRVKLMNNKRLPKFDF